MYGKLKSFLLDDVVFYALLIVGVGVVAFGLGRHSVQNATQVASGIHISQSMEPEIIETEGVLVVASRSGTKYHLPDCPGASQIKPDNKVEFTSIEAAEAAGYTPAANCEGI